MATIDEVVAKEIVEELKSNWSHLSGGKLQFITDTACQLAGRFMAAHNGPLPRATNVIEEAVKRFYQDH